MSRSMSKRRNKDSLKVETKVYKPVKPADMQVVKKSRPVERAVWAVLFVGLWLFLWIVWGDVLYMAQQYSFFAFDKTIMLYVFLQWDYPVLWVGRLMLCLFHFPVLGAAALSLCLTACGWLVARILRGTLVGVLLGVVLPIAYVIFIVQQGFCSYYEAEPGYICGRPLVALVVLVVLYVVVRAVFKKSASLATKQSVACIMVVAVLLVVAAVYTVKTKENYIVTAKMQRALEDADYEKMIELALAVEKPARSVCAYYIIALNQTNQIAERAYDIAYQFPDMHIISREGKEIAGTLYYSPDVDFYAGLVTSSYHEALERCVMDGPTVWRLKRMCQAALVNNEFALAAKLMHIIKLQPFEGAFIEKYSDFVYGRREVLSDPDFALVADLRPVRDAFEQAYKQPLFLGYNSALAEGKSARALINSILTCMYAKNKHAFMQRVRLLRGRWPRIVQEAFLVFNVKDPNVFKDSHIDRMTIATMRQFMTDIRPIVKQDKKEIAAQLRDKYLGFYPFYYYCENIADENYTYADAPNTGAPR